MKREWKPGDVALIPFARGDIRAMFTTDGWAISDAPDVRGIGEFGDVRPIVVIDPEDHQQVERLVKALSTGQPLIGLDPTNREMVDQAWVTHTQTALREFANPTPPKPEEPTGLGAVVEDVEGDLLTHIGNHDWVTPGGDSFIWSELKVVRVLSEGVTA